MGSSARENKWDFINFLKSQGDRIYKITDCGAGQGTYLNYILKHPRHIDRSKYKWYAVEGFRPYIDEFGLKKKYDSVEETLIQQYDFRSGSDLTIFGDILEHLTEEEMVDTFQRAMEDSKFVWISVPIIHYHQEAINGNELEIHKQEDLSPEKIRELLGEPDAEWLYGITGSFLYVNWSKLFEELKREVFIGITTTDNRLATYENTLKRIKEALPGVETRGVIDNLSVKPYGVAHQKNDLIRAFLESGKKYLYLIDDDIFPVSPKSICTYPFTGGSYYELKRKKVPVEEKNTLRLDCGLVEVSGEKPSGQVLFFTREALSKVGYFREDIGQFGSEHGDIAKRVMKSGLTTKKYPSIDLWNEWRSAGVASSIVDEEERSKLLDNARSNYWKNLDRSIVKYVPQRFKETKLW